jgi:hypothetical protein
MCALIWELRLGVREAAAVGGVRGGSAIVWTLGLRRAFSSHGCWGFESGWGC